jgi:hypothetical protein
MMRGGAARLGRRRTLCFSNGGGDIAKRENGAGLTVFFVLERQQPLGRVVGVDALWGVERRRGFCGGREGGGGARERESSFKNCKGEGIAEMVCRDAPAREARAAASGMSGAWALTS